MKTPEISPEVKGILRQLVPVWGVLMVLLVLTLVLAYMPLGRFNTPVGLLIGAAKAGLVVVIFMQLRRPDPLLRLAAGAGLLFLCFLFAMSFADLLTRAPGTQPGTVMPRILAPEVGPTGRPMF